MHPPRLAPLAALLLLSAPAPAATQVDLPGPPGSGEFGRNVAVLPNGNFVVTDPSFDQPSPPVADVGAVYLYNPDGLLISTLRGSTANDQVGSSGITVLPNGNFVVRSQNWDNTAAANAGAVTWGSATTGFIGGLNVIVSAANSLVGTSPDDIIGNGLTLLTNGNYVVRSQVWNSTTPAAIDAGAATWGNGSTGITGPISPSNSLVGTTANDTLGSGGITALTNGNYVVLSPNWDNTAPVAFNAGAATWGNGTTGITGTVSPANSLVGSSAIDLVGSNINALTNGNYVVLSPEWDNTAPAAIAAGAATWGNGATGVIGPVSPANSLVGSTTNDRVGSGFVPSLTNGNYVISSPFWDSTAPIAANVGAVTWGNGSTGITGPITPANSLVGTSVLDQVGGSGITALTNGNYVVRSPEWDNTTPAAVNAGAVTWGSGSTGITGAVSPANSLVGTTANDNVGITSLTALTNGNYVVASGSWDNAATVNAGAATWGNGSTGIKGPVSPTNSLVGSSPNDLVANSGVTALTNGNYVVRSPAWDNPANAATDAGAATWGNGSFGIKGPVSPGNSLVGSSSSNLVGGGSLRALANGNYVVGSPEWDNTTPAAVNAGAATWGNGSTGITGTVSPANSLIGSTANDQVGNFPIIALTSGNYVVGSPNWDNPVTSANSAGAVTWGNGTTGITGPISLANSLVGSDPFDQVGSPAVTPQANGTYVIRSTSWFNPAPPTSSAGAISLGNGDTGTTGLISSANSVLGTFSIAGSNLVFAYDPARHQLIVGRRDSNIVTLFRGDRLHSLAKTSFDAPGAPDIAYGKLGTTAVNPQGHTLSDFSLTGSGSTASRNRALFAFSPILGTDLVLQSGTPLSSLGGGLPANTTAITLLSQISNQPNRSLFQATIKGTGITPTNNRLLLLDNGISVQLLHRTGTPIGSGPFATARVKNISEVLQHHLLNIVTLSYTLATGGAINTSNDTGILLLDHSGKVLPNFIAREGQPAFGGGGTFAPLTGRASASLGRVEFLAPFIPAAGKPQTGLFSMTDDGSTNIRLVTTGDTAPEAAPATFSTFTGLTQIGNFAMLRATLAGSPMSENSGLWVTSANKMIVRTGQEVDSVNLPGVKFARILRFWPVTFDKMIMQVQLTGPNINSSNNQALVLSNIFLINPHQILLRTGTPAPGTGPAKLAAISAVDVNPVTGLYAILGTLSSAPSSSNQALWTGDPKLGNNTTLQTLRLPQLTLRKGNPYSTSATPSGIIRSITLKPAIDPTGAGGRGLAQALGANGDLALFITGDRNLTELVLLDR